MHYDLGQCDGPVWTDGCYHPANTYICSYSVITNRNGTPHEALYDLYLVPYELGGVPETHVCIRFGHEGADYLSPTSILEMTLSANRDDIYLQAVRLIQRLGYITFTRRPPKKERNNPYPEDSPLHEAFDEGQAEACAFA